MTSDNNVQKKCDYCGESISTNAGRCPYCGSILEVTSGKNYPITPPGNAAVNNVEGTKPDRPEQVQIAHNGGYVPDRRYINYMRNPLSNGMKVFLTILFTVIPGFGQLAGIITAIVFMNAEGDSDRKSFGVALMVASLIMFIFTFISLFILVIAFSSSQFAY